MIDHDQAQLLAAAALDASLSAAERSALNEHMASCASCRRLLAAMEGDQRMLASLPPAPVAARVGYVVAAAAAGRPRRGRWPMLAAATLLLVALGGAAVFIGSLPERRDNADDSPMPTSEPTMAPFDLADPTSLTVGGRPRGVDATDLDGDGDLDLVALADPDDAGRVAVLLGNGQGHFGSLARYDALHPFSIALADLDASGTPDLAVANPGGTYVSIAMGDGRGGFAEPTILDAGLQPRTVRVVDFDDDGDFDLLVPNASSDEVSILLGRGDGTFAEPDAVSAKSGPWSLDVGDLDGDGNQDVVVAMLNTGALAILSGLGGGAVAPARSIEDFGRPAAVAVADLDRDGFDDVVVRDTSGAVVVGYSDPGGPSFRLLELFGPALGEEFIGAFELADVNGDGWPDLVVGAGRTTDMLLYLNDREGGFGDGLQLVVGVAPVDVSVGDFNGDGRADIVTSNYGDGTLSVLLQR